MKLKFIYTACVLLFIVLFVNALMNAMSHDDHKIKSPAHRVALEEEGFYLVTLEPKAAERLGIETITGQTSSIPHAALFYDDKGGTWIYIESQKLEYKREPVSVTSIEDGIVYLNEEVNPSTKIVVTGIMELYGVESGFGGGGH